MTIINWELDRVRPRKKNMARPVKFFGETQLSSFQKCQQERTRAEQRGSNW